MSWQFQICSIYLHDNVKIAEILKFHIFVNWKNCVTSIYCDRRINWKCLLALCESCSFRSTAKAKTTSEISKSIWFENFAFSFSFVDSLQKTTVPTHWNEQRITRKHIIKKQNSSVEKHKTLKYPLVFDKPVQIIAKLCI